MNLHNDTDNVFVNWIC